MSSFWLPEPIYRSLPAVYAISGLGLLLIASGNLFAMLSAFLLIGAGVLVGLWRWRHRDTLSAGQAAREAFYRRKRRDSAVRLTHV